MKVKREARREAMLAVALDLFREVGFEAASMSQIAARVGGSKATLYNYFSSKEELLLERVLLELLEFELLLLLDDPENTSLKKPPASLPLFR